MSSVVMKVIQDIRNTILFSQISLFEIAIKQKIGKTPVFKLTIEDIYQQAVNDGFTFTPIQNQHLFNYHQIPFFENHRDPFDRLLIATALTENAIILSGDEKLNLYDEIVQVMW